MSASYTLHWVPFMEMAWEEVASFWEEGISLFFGGDFPLSEEVLLLVEEGTEGGAVEGGDQGGGELEGGK